MCGLNLKKIVFLLVGILFAPQIYPAFTATNHGGDAGWTPITSVDVSSGDGNHIFQKKEGTQTLYVSEGGAFASPFSGAQIVVNIVNGQTGSYNVNGVQFNSSHPLWRSGSVNYWIQLPGDPVGVFAPNLNLNIANTSAVSIKQYKYDSISPIGTIIRIYDMDIGTGMQITLTGQWTGKRIASEIECYDGIDVSGCQNARDTTLRPIYNAATGAFYVLSDIAGNIGNDSVDFSFGLVDASDNPITTIPQIFVDRISPMENEVTFQGIHLDATNTGYFFATGSTGSVFSLKLRDPEANTNWGVSGLYSYELTALHIQNHIGAINTITCDLSGTLAQYNPDGSLTVEDNRDINLTCPELWKEGDYIISYTGYDFVGNHISNSFPMHISPSNILGTIDLSTTEMRDSKFANLSDQYTYDVIIKDIHGNPIYNKDVLFLNQESSGMTAGFKTIMTNMVSNPISGNDALKEVPSGISTDNDGRYSFTLQSFAPGVFTETFKIILPQWNADYSNDGLSQIRFTTTGLENSFNRTFTGSLSIHNDEFRVGTVQQLDLVLNNIGCLPPGTTLCGPTYEIFDFFDTLNSSLDYEFSIKRNPLHTNDGTVENVTNPSLDMALNYIGGNIAGTGSPGIDSRPYITYPIGGELVSYFITLSSSGNATENLAIGNAKFYGAKIIGMIEGIGKQQLSGEDNNFADFTKGTLRDSIRKNAGILTRGMIPGKTANNIHYVEGDITISGNLPYETLIVKDGNITIDNDLNTGGQKLGIISLITNSQSNTVGNIYITPNVQYIDAIIYADGPVRSVDIAGSEYSIDSPTRTTDLRNQLFLHGSLFTKNTIGGALGASGTFILPGGYTTSDFDEAVQFDLNYIRTGNTGWDRTSPTENLDKDEDSSFIIMYNPEIQSNPPKGFSYK